MNNIIYVSKKIQKRETPPFVNIPADSTVGIEIHKLRMELNKTRQSRKASIIEAIVNVFSGAVIAFTLTDILAEPLGIIISGHANLNLTIILTIVSVIRGYLWRRFFNKR